MPYGSRTCQEDYEVGIGHNYVVTRVNLLRPQQAAERLREISGSPHVNEYPYIFEVFALGFYDIDEKEQIVADVIQQSIINFVKTG